MLTELLDEHEEFTVKPVVQLPSGIPKSAKRMVSMPPMVGPQLRSRMPVVFG
jgi:hypothetical protein